MFNLEVTVKHRHFLRCKFLDFKYNTKFYLVFVYAPAHENVKNVNWQEFTSFIKSLDLPYDIMVNEIKKTSEKTGGQTPTMSRFFRLNNFINRHETFEPSFLWLEIHVA